MSAPAKTLWIFEYQYGGMWHVVQSVALYRAVSQCGHEFVGSPETQLPEKARVCAKCRKWLKENQHE